MICRICNTKHLHQTYYDPEEPCICGHGVADSPWAYAGFRGLFAWLKYSVIGVFAEKLTSWCYQPWEW